ncbi:hypothetical protein [Microbulbifer litoralis]|uniref:hypothetical protein n=1 Tax=Microbulbifer litoralis TaxID=2933965 RepID=UPI002028F32F|nr:hypothetical protein [Microbulbifer sp. GX H0434]
MKVNLFLFAVLGFSFLVGCASGVGDNQIAATSSSGQKSESSNSSAQEKEKKICKVRPITGSRFKQKTCMTAEEWENMRVETKKMLDDDTRSKPTNY